MSTHTPSTAHAGVASHGLRAVTEFLEGAGVPFEVVEHRYTDTAGAESRALHIDPERVAKTVVLRGPTTWILAVAAAVTAWLAIDVLDPASRRPL